MLLADPMSRLSPLPSEESLNLQEVCLVQFSDARLATLRHDTSSHPELFQFFEKPFTLDGLKKQKRIPAHLRKYWPKLQHSDLDWRPALRNGKKYIHRSPPNCTLLDFPL